MWPIKKTKLTVPSNPSVNAGKRIYAVGDIHGCAETLNILHQKIATDAKDYAGKKIIIYLGDYIDRGKDSKKVITTLCDIKKHPLPDFEKVFIKGNHEQGLLYFLADYKQGGMWFKWGGDATMLSYGIEITHQGAPRPLQTLQAELKAALPTSHTNFLNKLEICHECGDYLFAHAGVNPNKTLEKQTPKDFMMSRDEFIAKPHIIGKRIVFGHTIFEEKLVESDKIGIDTGAYATGNLTAVVLEGTEVRFIDTSQK